MAIQFLNNVNADNGVLYVDAINNRVGIGTSSPAVQLELGNNAADEKLRLTGQASGKPGITFYNTTTKIGQIASSLVGMTVTSLGSGNMVFENGGAARLVIENGGNVGIGTSDPALKLEVEGGDGLLQLSTTSSTGSPYMSFNQAGARRSFIQHVDSGDNLKLASEYGGMQFFTGTGGTETVKMTIQSGGNVGIGTTSPASNRKLHVAGNARVDSTFYLGTDESCAFFRYYNALIITNSASTNITLGGGPGSVNNNVYVGNGFLDVSGYIRGKNYFYLEDATGTLRTTLRSESTYATLDNGTNTLNTIANAHIFLRSTTEVMRIHTNNNVGIGTTSPGAKLDVINTGGSATNLTLAQTYSGLTVKPYSAVDSKLTFSANGGNTQIIQATNNASTTGRQIALQPFGGNVGIGTTSPGEKLEVNGTVKATATTDAYKGYIKSIITCTPLMKTANTSYNYIPYNSTIFSSTADYFNRMVAAYDGRVKKIILRHISGTTPTATGMKFKKEVNGTVNATEYTATVTGGASASFTAIYDFANSDFTFNEGDSIGILAQTSGGTGNIGGASAQIIVEYNIT